jgi:hypothetical protein
MTNFRSQIIHILQDRPEYIRELIILLGVIKLCDEMNVGNFETIVKTFGIKSNHWWPLINEIVEDDEFEEIIEGTLYEKVLEIQLWLSNHQHDVEKGSVLWHLMKKWDDEKK